MSEYLRHCDDTNVLGKTRAAVARPPEAGEDAAQALGADAPVDGMRGWRRSTRYPATRLHTSLLILRVVKSSSFHPWHTCSSRRSIPPRRPSRPPSLRKRRTQSQPGFPIELGKENCS